MSFLKKTTCLECEDTGVNCLELGIDDNWICIACLQYNLDLYKMRCMPVEKEKYTVTENTEKIDPANVPF